ncbi:MAG: hypothetical protein RL701_1594, partial [Pseudomonadota bacterium]
LKTPYGIQRLRMAVQESEGKLLGTLSNQLGTFELASAQLQVDALLVRAGVKLPFGEIMLEFQGVLRNDKIWGKCKSPFGYNDFMGTRERERQG